MSITGNVPALADFYARVLGIKAEGDEEHVELCTDGAHLAIFSVHGMERWRRIRCRGLDMAVLPWVSK